MSRKSRYSVEDVINYVKGMGLCVASNMITVDEYPVGYMYREKPDNGQDSGWRFLSGYEDEEYMSKSSNHQICDVYTIAELDPDIIPYLDAVAGMAYEKESKSSDFVLIED